MLYHNLTVLALLVRSPRDGMGLWLWTSAFNNLSGSRFRSQVELGSPDEGAFLQEARSPRSPWAHFPALFPAAQLPAALPISRATSKDPGVGPASGVLLLPSADHCSPACAGKEHSASAHPHGPWRLPEQVGNSPQKSEKLQKWFSTGGCKEAQKTLGAPSGGNTTRLYEL